jgi:hypothetical protein
MRSDKNTAIYLYVKEVLSTKLPLTYPLVDHRIGFNFGKCERDYW